VKSFPKVLAIYLRERWAAKPAPQAANLALRGNIRPIVTSYHNAIYKSGAMPFTYCPLFA
jgi:hypothetical protein